MFKYGPIKSTKTGQVKDIDVNLTADFVKDILIGGAIALAGIAYIAIKSFKNGADEYDKAELRTLKELDLVHDGMVDASGQAYTE